MEKISYQATYTRISLYAQVSSSTAPGKTLDAKPGNATDQSGAEAMPAAAGNDKGRPCQRNKDGDTFTLSIEAETIQVSGTLLIDDAGSAAKGAKGAKGPAGGKIDKAGDAAAMDGAGDPDALSAGGFVNALLDALDKSEGRHQHKRRHHFPQLTEPQDLADKLIQHLDMEHARAGGAKADFEDDVRKKLDAWKPSAGRVSMEYREFRSEVHLKMTASLDSWLGGSDSGSGAGAAQDSGDTANNPATSGDVGLA